MDMMIPGKTVSQLSAAINQEAASNSNTAKVLDDGFRKAFVQQMINQSEAADEQAESWGLISVMPNLAAISLDHDLHTILTRDGITLAIDELVDMLDAEMNAVSTKSDRRHEELYAALDSIYALLALLGVSVVPPNGNQNNQTNSNQTSRHELGINPVRLHLQEALLHMQTIIPSTTLKHVLGQEPLQLIGSQLQALASTLADDGSILESKPAARYETTVPPWLNVQPTAINNAGTLLQRLAQQAVHPSLMNANIAAMQVGNVQQVSYQVEANADALTQLQPPVMGAEQMRDYSALHTKSATPTVYVLAEEFANTMSSMIVEKFNIRSANGISEAKLMLFPEQLGQVDVKLSMQNGVLTALFQTDSAMAKELLENQLSHLRVMLQAQGLSVDKLEVAHSQAAAGFSQQHAGQGHLGQQSFGNRPRFKDEEKAADAAFESEMVEQAAIQGLGYGRAINETV